MVPKDSAPQTSTGTQVLSVQVGAPPALQGPAQPGPFNCTQCGSQFHSAGAWNPRCLACIKLTQGGLYGLPAVQGACGVCTSGPGVIQANQNSLVTSRALYNLAPPLTAPVSVPTTRFTLNGAKWANINPQTMTAQCTGCGYVAAIQMLHHTNGDCPMCGLTGGSVTQTGTALNNINTGPLYSTRNILALLTPGVRALNPPLDIHHDTATADFVLTFQGHEVGRLHRTDIANGAYKATFPQICLSAQAIAKQIMMTQGVPPQTATAVQNQMRQAQIQQAAHQANFQAPNALLQQQYGAMQGQSYYPQPALGSLGAALSGTGQSTTARPTRTAKSSLATSDQLEQFIRYLEGEGIPEKVARKVSLNTFIIWMVAEAEEAEGDKGESAERLAKAVAALKAEYAAPA